MRQHLYALLFHFAALVLLAEPTLAQIPDRYDTQEIVQEDDFTYTIRGTFTAKGAPESLNRNASVLIGFEGELRLGLLALDPVVSFKMRFKPLGGRVTIPNFDPGAQEYDTIGLGEVPADALEKLDLNNVRVAFNFSGKANKVAFNLIEEAPEVVIVEDSGVFFGQGEWSFNVPDGYSWRNVFYKGGFGKLDFTDWPHVPEDRARTIWNDMSLNAFQVINADLLLSGLHDWYRDNDTTADYFAMLRAIDRVSEGISISYGYDAKKAIRRDLSEAATTVGNGLKTLRGERTQEEVSIDGDQPDYMADFANATNALRQILIKLTDLPDEFREGDNHAPYEQAVSDVNDIINAPRELKREFRAQGPEPDMLPRGYEGEFDPPPFSLFEIRRNRSHDQDLATLVNSSTGEQIAEWDRYRQGQEDYRLVGGRYLVPFSKEVQKCQDGYFHIHTINLNSAYTFPQPNFTFRLRCASPYDIGLRLRLSTESDNGIKIYMGWEYWDQSNEKLQGRLCRLEHGIIHGRRSRN